MSKVIKDVWTTKALASHLKISKGRVSQRLKEKGDKQLNYAYGENGCKLGIHYKKEKR